MEKQKLTPEQEQAKKALLTGHFPYMMQAVAIAYQLVPAWRHAEKGTPCSILDLFQAAKRYDETHPRKEGDLSFFYVSLEGAIGYTPTGLEFQVVWLFYPMEPGKERDAVLAKVKAEVEAAEKAEAEAAAAAAKAAAAPKKRFCSNCGAPIKNPEAKFCTNCGQSLE
jgi:NADH pyrophosphatase NudC (nudix superfamily)